MITPLGEHQLLLFLLQFALLLLVARVLGQVAVRFGLPSVVGELLGGFLLGPSLLGQVAPGLYQGLFPRHPEQVHLLEVVSGLGVIMLLVLTGLETDVGLIVRKGRGAAAISLGGIAVPFASGFLLGNLLPKAFLAAPDKRLVFALFVGTAMSISAIPVIARVLMEMNVIRRDIGQITLAAGMIDDTIGWILLSVVAGLASSGSVDLGTVAKSLLSVLGVLVLAFTVGRRAVSRLMRTLDNHVEGDTVLITTLMVLALGFGAVTQSLGLEAVLGAFITGILVGQVKRFDDRLRHMFEQVALGVFAPVFFANSGLKVDLVKVFRPQVLLVGLLVLTIATVGKFAGAYIGARAGRLGHWEALALGSGMNARGAMEIIVATVGLSRGILTPEMYAIILLVAISTSLMAPPLLRWTLSNVDFGEEEQARLADEQRRQESFVANLKRVLLPTRGGSDGTLAAQMTGMMLGGDDVEVTKLYLRPPSENGADVKEAPPSLEQLDVHLDDTRTVVRQADGDMARVILSEAGKGYDLLVVANSGRPPGPESPFEGFIDEVVQDAPCPILVVSEPPEWGSRPVTVRQILVPVSGTKADRDAAEVAFSMAAGRADVVVDLVHVVSGPQHTVRVGGGQALLNAVELGDDLVNRVADLGRSMNVNVQADVVVVADHPEDAIVERATRRGDLIVLASSRRPVTQRAFLGHRVDHVLAHAHCPVVVVSTN